MNIVPGDFNILPVVLLFLLWDIIPRTLSESERTNLATLYKKCADGVCRNVASDCSRCSDKIIKACPQPEKECDNSVKFWSQACFGFENGALKTWDESNEPLTDFQNCSFLAFLNQSLTGGKVLSNVANQKCEGKDKIEELDFDSNFPKGCKRYKKLKDYFNYLKCSGVELQDYKHCFQNMGCRIEREVQPVQDFLKAHNEKCWEAYMYQDNKVKFIIYMVVGCIFGIFTWVGCCVGVWFWYKKRNAPRPNFAPYGPTPAAPDGNAPYGQTPPAQDVNAPHGAAFGSSPPQGGAVSDGSAHRAFASYGASPPTQDGPRSQGAASEGFVPFSSAYPPVGATSNVDRNVNQSNISDILGRVANEDSNLASVAPDRSASFHVEASFNIRGNANQSHLSDVGGKASNGDSNFAPNASVPSPVEASCNAHRDSNQNHSSHLGGKATKGESIIASGAPYGFPPPPTRGAVSDGSLLCDSSPSPTGATHSAPEKADESHFSDPDGRATNADTHLAKSDPGASEPFPIEVTPYVYGNGNRSCLPDIDGIGIGMNGDLVGVDVGPHYNSSAPPPVGASPNVNGNVIQSHLSDAAGRYADVDSNLRRTAPGCSAPGIDPYGSAPPPLGTTIESASK